MSELSKQSPMYEYGCVMLYVQMTVMEKLHNLIDKEDLYDDDSGRYGLEIEPHVTLLYGLHKEVTLDDVTNTVHKVQFNECKVKNVSIFDNGNYDVLKFDVQGENLSRVNKELKKFPYTTEYEDYHPHCTIAYLQKGKGQEYVDKLNSNLDIQNLRLNPSYVVYSEANGTKTKITVALASEEENLH